MASNPSASVDKIIELTDSEEEENTNSEEDESEIDICVRDTSCAPLSKQRYSFVEESPISLGKGFFGISGLLRIFFSVTCYTTPMPEHREPWAYRATPF